MRTTRGHTRRLLLLLLLLMVTPGLSRVALAEESSPPADIAQATALIAAQKFDEVLNVVEPLMQTEKDAVKLQQLRVHAATIRIRAHVAHLRLCR